MPKKKTHEEYVEEVAKINPNIEVVGTYIDTDTKIQHKCKIDGHIWEALPHNILRGKGCPRCKFSKQSLEQTKSHESYVLELSQKRHNVIVLGTYVNNKTKILHKCLICGYEWEVSPDKVLQHHLCPVCAHKVIGSAPDYQNSIWANVHLRHALSKYIDEETMKQYMPSSGQRIKFSCPDCGVIKEVSVNNLCQQRFRCVCSDGVSFPNKFVFAVISQIDKSITTEFVPKWAKNKRYDLYIKNFNMIIENHGPQHYEEVALWKRDLKEEQENDKLKEILAQQNGIINYIVLDCRYSTKEWIKNSIMTSRLPQLLGFNEGDIDWDYAFEYANKNLIKEAMSIYKEGMSAKEFAKILNVSHATANKYLNIAHSLNWCNYDKHLIRCKGQQRRRSME